MNAILISALVGIFFMFSSTFFKGLQAKSWAKFLPLVGLGVALGGNINESWHGGSTINIFKDQRINSWLFFDMDMLNIQFSTIVVMLLYFWVMGKQLFAQRRFAFEYVALLLFCFVGILLSLSFNNLLILFLAIEILSLPQYILAGSNKFSIESAEAALKYFLMGALFSAILLFGIALLYGSTGSFAVQDISLVSSNYIPFSLSSYLQLFGMLLIIVALFFKAGIVPFHFWVPDVYQGAPSLFVSFMSGITKIGVFFILFRFLNLYGMNHYSSSGLWLDILSSVLFLSLIIGNLLAMVQKTVKRMLAYSGIAQASFLLFALYDGGAWSQAGIHLFLVGYALSLIGLFAVLSEVDAEGKSDYLLKGMHRKSPIRALLLTVCLLSLAGVPGTIGFLGKFYMLAAGVEHAHLGLVIMAVLFAGVSLYYYLMVIKAVYFEKTRENVRQLSTLSSAHPGYIILIIMIIVIGFIGIPDLHWWLASL